MVVPPGGSLSLEGEKDSEIRFSLLRPELGQRYSPFEVLQL